MARRAERVGQPVERVLLGGEHLAVPGPAEFLEPDTVYELEVLAQARRVRT